MHSNRKHALRPYLLFSIFLIFSSSFHFLQAQYVLPSHHHADDCTDDCDWQTVRVRFGEQDAQSVKARVVGDYLITEGDIIVGKVNDPGTSRAAVVSDFGNRWPNSTIPYVIEDGYPDENMIYYAINHINANSNLCLVPRTSESDYVEFVNSSGCSSWIGMIGGAQDINVSPNCGIGATIHEILHAAGFYHEQSRADRDHYVTINFDNVQNGKGHNFDKYSHGFDEGPYDYESIMHYGPTAFSSNGEPTIEINTPPGNSSTNIGQRSGLSHGDMSAINEIYPSDPSCGLVSVPANLSFQSQGTITINGSVVNMNDVVIQNSGNSTIGSASVHFFVAPVGSYSVSFFASASIPSLAPGATHRISRSKNLSSLSDGEYYFGAWINYAENPEEGTYDDNIFKRSRPVMTLPSTSNCDHQVAVNQKPIPDGMYQASMKVTSAGSVNASAEVTFKAGDAVEIQPNFEVAAGANFNIIIGSCD